MHLLIKAFTQKWHMLFPLTSHCPKLVPWLHLTSRRKCNSTMCPEGREPGILGNITNDYQTPIPMEVGGGEWTSGFRSLQSHLGWFPKGSQHVFHGPYQPAASLKTKIFLFRLHPQHLAHLLAYGKYLLNGEWEKESYPWNSYYIKSTGAWRT